MTDGKDTGELQESQEEPMLSTGSSGASFSFEHSELGIMRNPTNPSSSLQSSNIGTVNPNFFESLLISGDTDPPAEACLEITEQPKQKELRFRYECEGRSAGSLLGVKSSADRKTYPTVKIKNYKGPAKIVATLVTRQIPHQLHPNGLVGKYCKNGICTMEVKENHRMSISFPNLGIQCAKKKDIASALEERRGLGVDPFNQPATSHTRTPNNEYEMNVVCLCFQAFLPDPLHPDQFTKALPPQVTHPIYDKKGASLNIARVDRTSGSVQGGDEIFILCDKVQKDDIEVVFFKDEWEDHASFGPSDIHRQVAIVCRTPCFKDIHIQQTVIVQFKLRRKSDKETSDPMDFTYVPIDPDADGVEAKRRKKSPHFDKFFKRHPVKPEEGGKEVPLCQDMTMASQQGQQQQEEPSSSSAASSDPNVRQILRNKIEQNSSKQPNPQIDPSHDVRQLPSVFGHPIPARNPSVAVYSEASASYTYSNKSSMSFGTMTQCSPPATPTTITPFVMPPIPVPSTTRTTPTGAQLPPVTNTITMVNCNDFVRLAAAQTGSGNPTSIDSANGIALVEETILQMLQNEGLLNYSNLGDEITCTSLEVNPNRDTEHLPSIEQLTALENFDPNTLSLQPNTVNVMESMPMENVTDSLSIPYSNSVELGLEETNNPNHIGNDLQNG